MKKVIFMISGLSDVEVAGNQSLKNGVKFLSEFGYKIVLFTFMPKNYNNLQDPKKVFNSNVEVFRLPDILSPVINLGKIVKDLLGKRKVSILKEGKATNGSGSYLREYNPIGRIFYLVFLFVLYIPVELSRNLVYSFRRKPSLIYGVNCQGAIVASLLGRLLKKPVITRFHGVCISEIDLINWKNKLFVLDEILGLKAQTDAIIMTNDGTKGDKILKMLNVKEDKIHFWVNGIDLGDFAIPNHFSANDMKTKLGIEREKVILMVSRLTKWKGTYKGIHCIDGIVNKHNMKDMVLLILGDGPDGDRLKKMAQELGLSRYIVFCGNVSHRELYKYFLIADIFLSLYDNSNLGNPLLEALYFGVPIVTIDDGSTSDLLIDGYNSLLVNAEDIYNDLPLAVLKIIKEPTLRQKISEMAKKTYQEKIFTWQQRMEVENSLIQKVSS